MAVKTTGAEWKRFYADQAAWPKGAWHDDEEITINGEAWNPDDDISAVDDAARMVVSGGVVFLREHDDDGPTLEAHFKKWRKAQSTAFGTVEVPKALAQAVKVAILAAGGKVHGI